MGKSENILKEFCSSSDDPRDYLRAPMRIGQHIYATTGWVAIRVPDDGTIAANDCHKLPRMPALFEVPVEQYSDMPALPSGDKCEACKGSGREFKESCDECDGQGDFSHGNHMYDCKGCDGEGKVDMLFPTGPGQRCADCIGTGCKKGSTYKVGAATYQLYLLTKISTLPGIKIHIPTDGDSPAKFIFDGGEGVVLPCRSN